MQFGQLFAGAAAAAVLANAAAAQTADAPRSINLQEYRIQSDDCSLSGCGTPAFQSQADAAAFFAADRAARSALAKAAGNASPFENWRRSFTPFGFEGKQVVYLDFDAGGDPTFPVCFSDGTLFGVFQDHFYTPAERDAIQARIEHDYRRFNYVFTQTRPQVGEFSTVLFGQNDAPADCSQGSNITLTPTGGVSILFGQAENIDFRNQSKTDSSFVDPSLWEFLAQLDAAVGTNNLEAFSGIPTTPANRAAVVSLAVSNQSSNTSAHELGHIQGLRHHDSIGAPGDGLPASGVPDPNAFIPVFTGPQNAAETPLHLMASGASVGLTLQGETITDRFFSERSDVKLAIARNGKRVLEEDFFDGRRRPIALPLLPMLVPNTLEEGENADSRLLNADGLLIGGSISQTGEVDEYRFIGRKGKFVNIELVSFSDSRFTDPVVAALKLSKLNPDGSRTEVASNIQTFEPFDPLIFDQELPATGVYVIEVDAPNIIFIDLDGDGAPDPFPLDETGNGDLRHGDYELLVYSVDGKLGRPRGFDFYSRRHPLQSASRF